MTNVEKVLIENVQENEFVSDLLKRIRTGLT